MQLLIIKNISVIQSFDLGQKLLLVLYQKSKCLQTNQLNQYKLLH